MTYKYEFWSSGRVLAKRDDNGRFIKGHRHLDSNWRKNLGLSHKGKKYLGITSKPIIEQTKERQKAFKKFQESGHTKEANEKRASKFRGKSKKETGHKLNCKCFICKAKRHESRSRETLIKISESCKGKPWTKARREA